MTIRSDELEDIVEYEYKSYEHEWDFPDTEIEMLGRATIRTEDREKARAERNERLGVTQEKEERPKREKKERVPRASRDGLITVQQIAGEFKIDAGDARAILRKAKVEKPAVGWAGDETWAKGIREIIKKGLK